MHVAMIGTGYVGLVSGTCFAEFGANVVCVDTMAEKIDTLNRGEIPIFEPGLEKMVKENKDAGRLSFTTNVKEAIKNADIVCICVGTPTDEKDGSADLSYVFSAAETIAKSLDGFTVIVTKSTVPVGTGRKIEAIIKEHAPQADFAIASNPEFLREGAAIQDFTHPDRVVVGVEDERARKAMYDLYRPLYLNETPMLFTDLETAELTKYAANTFLATKIGFINEIADLCEKVGANVQHVARGMGLDGRIGSKFLHPSPGYGGSCFPKDTRALVHIAQTAGSPCNIVETVVEKNEARKLHMVDKIVDACGGDIKGKTISVLGLTFKPMTDDMRESASLVIIPELIKRSATIRTFDPEGMENAQKLMQQEEITWCDDTYNTIDGGDALVILTEWNKFRNLNMEKVKSLLTSPIFIDLRNIYKAEDMQAHGFTYVSIGRKTVN